MVYIRKGETKNFNDYDVYEVFENWEVYEGFWRTVLRLLLRRPRPTITKEILLSNVVEANDKTGLVTYQLTDDEGRQVFTNGLDEIVLDNPCKLLLLLPNIRTAFHYNGFRPKLTTQYKERLRIWNKGPQQTIVVGEKPELLESSEVTV